MPDTFTTAGLACKTIEIFGVESGLGARVAGCGRGPASLRADGLEGWLRATGLDAEWRHVLTPESALTSESGGAVLPSVAGICRDLADGVEDALGRHAAVVVLGGDHSCAVGTWSGAARHLRRHGPLGLIWIDAHMDSHLPETSPSGTLHGMPLACLMGFGEQPLTDIAGALPAVAPQHVCLLGVRSYEAPERDFLERLGVRVIYMDEVDAKGLDAAMDEALRIAGTGTAGVGISIDLDAVDPADAPGVGSPEPGGIRAGALTAALRRARRNTEFAGVEIAEYNPDFDRGGATARIVRDLLAAAHPVEEGHHG